MKTALTFFLFFSYWLSLIQVTLGTPTQPSPTQIDTVGINTFIQQYLQKTNISGIAVAIVDKHKTLFTKGYGQTSNNHIITGNTPFAIASLSKSFTALAIIHLVEAGKIKLTLPVAHYLPTFRIHDPEGSKITVEQLLYQTSGLSDLGFPDMKLDQPHSLEKAMVRLQQAHLSSSPGQKYHYHNPNYQILARLVEVGSQEEFSTYLKKHIFVPLHMDHTVNVTHTQELYTKTGGNLTKGYYSLFGTSLAKEEPDWFVSGSAGMVSTVNDMANWLRLHLNNGTIDNTQLLSSKGIQILHTPPTDVKSNYAMGWKAGNDDELSHGGILWTYQSEQTLLIKEGYGIVVLCNNGINAFQDFHGFMEGITTLLRNQPVEASGLSNNSYVILSILAIGIAIGMGIYRLYDSSKWIVNYSKGSKLRSWFVLSLRLIPCSLLLFIPHLITFASGRVLHWEGIFLMMPEIIIWLGIVAIMNILIACGQLILLTKARKSDLIAS
ncbi:serine hydrolase domain-containing protein [Cytophagaceae bacterium YF14B1]|uniref:Serine hydrolase domain-containing protein n=1 Tax=Xanthocytophaga flava TaxID=3048013 RepID=A0AAE3QS90_9BACT|nr:serine hydrolase domain-containing protein [Xanthocytophaga flavus]MDJ1481914.1 serine hydrolase domain-containing protein [Xanthocytophaga flavus]